MQGTGGEALAPTGPRRGVPASYVVLTALVVVALDQATKVAAVEELSTRPPVDLVPGVLDLTLTRNSGAAFSLGEGSTIVLTLVSAIVVAAIVRVSRRVSTRGWALALGGIAGGALGNLLDRLLREPDVGRGHVVDWIHLSHWPVFNLADSAIVLSGIAMVLLSGKGGSATRPRVPRAGGRTMSR
jgi:signal peptidase II